MKENCYFSKLGSLSVTVVVDGGAVVTAVTATLVVPPAAVTTCITPPDSISRFLTRARLKSVSTLGKREGFQ